MTISIAKLIPEHLSGRKLGNASHFHARPRGYCLARFQSPNRTRSEPNRTRTGRAKTCNSNFAIFIQWENRFSAILSHYFTGQRISLRNQSSQRVWNTGSHSGRSGKMSRLESKKRSIHMQSSIKNSRRVDIQTFHTHRELAEQFFAFPGCGRGQRCAIPLWI